MKFDHPLARSAKIWPAELVGGERRDVLVVVTTLELDPEGKKFKPVHVERLSQAARDFLAERPEKATGFVLMNKPKT